jgi:hypothetical protein
MGTCLLRILAPGLAEMETLEAEVHLEESIEALRFCGGGHESSGIW